MLGPGDVQTQTEALYREELLPVKTQNPTPRILADVTMEKGKDLTFLRVHSVHLSIKGGPIDEMIQ